MLLPSRGVIGRWLRRPHDRFVRPNPHCYSVELTTGERPISPKLPPGEYFYKVEVEDLQASKVNSAKTQFKLVAVGKN